MRTLSLTLVCIFALTAATARAQSSAATAEKAPLWEVHLHLQKSFASPLGKRALAMFEEANPNEYDQLLKFIEAIGLDPRKDIGEVVVYGDGFEETDATIVADLGSSTGNLEGWILAAPGYQSQELDASTQLHSMLVEDKNARAWFALPQHKSTGKYYLIGSLHQQRTTDLAKQVLAGDTELIANPVEGTTVFAFSVNDLSSVPLEIDENDPGSAIVKIIQQIGLSIASNDDNMRLSLNIAANDAVKARQVSQLLMGLKAFVQLAPLDEPEARKVASIVDTLVVNHVEGQNDVQATLSAPYDLLEELLKNID